MARRARNPTGHGTCSVRPGSQTSPVALRPDLGMAGVATAEQLLEKIRDYRRPALRARPQPLGHPAVGQVQTRRLGSRLSVDGGRHCVWPVHRVADLRGGSRRVPPPGWSVHLHAPPVFVRLAEHEPPLHLPTLCCAPLGSVAADVHHRRIGADGVDHVQSGGAPRRARPLRTPGQADPRPRLDVASRPCAEPPGASPQPGSDHDRLRPGEPGGHVPRHVGPAQRTPSREAPGAARDGHRAGRGGQAHTAALRSLPAAPRGVGVEP